MDMALDMGGKAVVAALKSIATSLICQWYKNNAVIRYAIGEKAYQTEAHLLLKAETAMTISQMKWDTEITGAPYTVRGSGMQQMPQQFSQYSLNLASQQQGVDPMNPRADPTGRLPTWLAVVIIIKKATGNYGIIELSTPEEAILLGNSKYVPLYTEINDVLIARFRRSWGFDYKFRMEGGFKNESYPGPVYMDVGDTLELCFLGTDNLLQPSQTASSVKGFITGTLTWQTRSQSASQKAAPVIENA